jgi:excisionase family DNA binding protein
VTREEVRPVAYRVRTFAQLIEASDSGVRELIASGAIRSFKVGGLLRIPASELVKFTGQKEKCPCGCDAGHKNQEKEKVHA